MFNSWDKSHEMMAYTLRKVKVYRTVGTQEIIADASYDSWIHKTANWKKKHYQNT